MVNEAFPEQRAAELRGALEQQVAEILSRPGALLAGGMMNPNVVSPEEARIVSSLRRGAAVTTPTPFRFTQPTGTPVTQPTGTPAAVGQQMEEGTNGVVAAGTEEQPGDSPIRFDSQMGWVLLLGDGTQIKLKDGLPEEKQLANILERYGPPVDASGNIDEASVQAYVHAAMTELAYTPAARIVTGAEVIAQGLAPDTPVIRGSLWKISANGDLTRVSDAEALQSEIEARKRKTQLASNPPFTDRESASEEYKRVTAAFERQLTAMLDDEKEPTWGQSFSEQAQSLQRTIDTTPAGPLRDRLENELERLLAVDQEPFAGFPTAMKAEEREQELTRQGIPTERYYDPSTDTIRLRERAAEAGPGTFEELAFQHIQDEGGVLTKDVVDRLLYVDSIRDQLDRRRITPLEAFNLAAPFMQNPQHLREMMTALMSETGQYMSQPDFEGAQRLNAPNTQTPTGPGAETRPETNSLQQAIKDIPGGLTLEQWSDAGGDLQRNIFGMELAPDLETYTQNPEIYSAQAGALVNELNSRLTQAGAIPGHTEAQAPPGAFDPSPVPGASMRTSDEENELRRLLASRMHFGVMGGGVASTGGIVDRPGAEFMEHPEDAPEVARRVSRRGNVPMPNALQERMKELLSKTPHSGELSWAPGEQQRLQSRAFPGTPFKSYPDLAKDPYGYIATQERNKLQQARFLGRGPKRRTFA